MDIVTTENAPTARRAPRRLILLGALALVMGIAGSIVIGSIGNTPEQARATAVDYYLQGYNSSNTPLFSGDSTTVGYSGMIRVVSHSWSSSNNSTGTLGTGSAGTPTMGPLSITKLADNSTTQLFSQLAKGTRIATVVLTGVYPLSGGSSYRGITITLTNVSVTADSLGGSTDRPTETVQFGKYDKISISTIMQNSAGTPQSPVSSCYNLSTNTAGTTC